MSGGIIQLAASGVEDLYITDNPQITFFKVVYRRHTNFSIEEVPQSFIHKLDFGKKSSCILSRAGDLISNINLVIELPNIPQIYNVDNTIDNHTRFAWVRKIGYYIIKSIDIKIGEKLIDRHYGEWINIWSELTNKNKDKLDKMIGNIDDLITYSFTKNSYKLFIPLYFWFCRDISLSLPILCLQYNNVCIDLELEDFKNCYKVSPTHSILLNDSICNFETDEYIIQEIDDDNIAVGQFSYFDEKTNLLYYSNISNNLFKTCNISSLNPDDKNYIEKKYELINKYKIKGLKSNYSVNPYIITNETNLKDNQKNSLSYYYNPYQNIKIKNCFLLVNYIFLDEDERNIFYKHSHQYLIEQLINCCEEEINTQITTHNINIYNSTKLLIWTLQQLYLKDNKDYFNYTNSYQYNDILYNQLNYDDFYINQYLIDNQQQNLLFNQKNNPTLNNNYNHNQIGKGLIKKSTLMFNYNNRMKEETDLYFNNIQNINYFKNNIDNGINIYSFALNPDNINPSGTCNMSKISNIQIKINSDKCINLNNNALFKCWGLTYNILYINAGLGGLIFIN